MLFLLEIGAFFFGLFIAVHLLHSLFHKRIDRWLYKRRTEFTNKGATIFPSVALFENVYEEVYSHEVKSYLKRVETSKFFVGCTYEPAYFYDEFKKVIEYETNKDIPDNTANKNITAARRLKQFEEAFLNGGYPTPELIANLRNHFFEVMEDNDSFTHFCAMSEEVPDSDNSFRFLFVPFNINSTNANDVRQKTEFRTRNPKEVMLFFKEVLNYHISCFVINESNNLVIGKKSDFIIFYLKRWKWRSPSWLRSWLGDKTIVWNYNANSRELVQIQKFLPFDPHPIKGTQYESILESFQDANRRERSFMPLDTFINRLFSL